MKKWVLVFAAAGLFGVAPASAQGLLSALKDKVTGGGQEPQETPAAQAQSTPPPAESGARNSRRGTARPNVKVVEGTPPPSAGTPQPTPDKETIRRGAQKLRAQLETEKIPGDLFRRYAGKWKGDFWVYSPEGKLEESKSVSLEFTPGSGGTMKMESFSFDRISRTWVIAETATYENQGDSVQVTIQRPNTSVSHQTGRYNDGQLFLTNQGREGMEHFRERVDGKRLLIDGFGAYPAKQGGEYHVFIGRFLKEGGR